MIAALVERGSIRVRGTPIAGFRRGRLVGARSTDDTAEDCRRENGLQKSHIDPSCSDATKNVAADALVATRKVAGQTGWRNEELMLMRGLPKCNRRSPVPRVAPVTMSIARMRDDNCARIRRSRIALRAGIFGETRG